MDDFSEIDDRELVRKTLANRNSFALIIDRYQDKLARYIRRFSGLPNDDVDDVLQESFIKMYRNLNSFDHELSFSAWAYRITHNETVNHIRRNSRHKTVQLETTDEESLSLMAVLEHSIDIAHEIKTKESAAQVRTILMHLAPRYREVLVLRYLEEKDYREISDIIQKPMGTVATLLNRAKTQFKKHAGTVHLTS